MNYLKLKRQDFQKAIYNLVKKIPYGRVMTYGQIAACLGFPRAAQYVGWCLHWADHNKVPYQRVLNRFGGLAAGYPEGGRKAHEIDLLREKIKIQKDGTVNLEKYLWNPKGFSFKIDKKTKRLLSE